MTNIAKRWCTALLLSLLACLFGCVEIEDHLRVHDDGSFDFKGTIKIDPQYEALVLPQMKQEMSKQLPPGARVDYSQRIDGKAAVVVEAEGAAAAAMIKDGSTTITVSDAGFMKKRYEYRDTIVKTPEMPVPHRSVVTLPGSIESVSGGKKTADDTVEFDSTHAKRGTVFTATSTAYAFSLGGGAAATNGANGGTTAWLMPLSIASVCAGALLLLTGRLRSRREAQGAMPVPSMPSEQAAPPLPAAAEEAATVFCTECGTPNAAGRKFCGQCGHALE